MLAAALMAPRSRLKSRCPRINRRRRNRSSDVSGNTPAPTDNPTTGAQTTDDCRRVRGIGNDLPLFLLQCNRLFMTCPRQTFQNANVEEASWQENRKVAVSPFANKHRIIKMKNAMGVLRLQECCHPLLRMTCTVDLDKSKMRIVRINFLYNGTIN